jgi:aspartate 1-decarboxylase
MLRNKHGQMTTGGIVMLAMAIIIGSVLAVAVATEQATLTTTREIALYDFTDSAVNGTYNLVGQAVSNFVASNATAAGTVIGAGNYTINNYQNVDGEYTATITVNVPTATADEFGWNWIVNYTYEPTGYNQDAASRGIARLPLLFFILAILAAAVIGIRSWITR